MNAKEITRKLYGHFHNQKYQINNQYIFDWESDFFCMSQQGYCTEVEVKISAADFKKDFEKEKHNIFKACLQGKKYMVRDLGPNSYSGDVICTFQTGKLVQNRHSYRRMIGEHWFYSTDMRHDIVKLRAPCNRIWIIDFNKFTVPHKYYFAVPAGFFDKNPSLVPMVPKYAGVIVVDESGCKFIKNAPMIHKRPLDIAHVLLDKFYYKFRHLSLT